MRAAVVLGNKAALIEFRKAYVSADNTGDLTARSTTKTLATKATALGNGGVIHGMHTG